ncbi:hypothetical protein [Salinarimonas sp.]|uniref:hypothetical protein n=1 Tax=Salinarimonas sp. TaxID=2766526 RepID=UPI0032D8F58B
MQTVAKFQFEAPSAAEAHFEEVFTILDRWASRKLDGFETENYRIKRSGKEAQFVRKLESVDSRLMFSMDLAEPVSGGALHTSLRVLLDAGNLLTRVRLAVTSEVGLAPPKLDLHSPRFIRQILETRQEWRVSGNDERVFARWFRVDAGNVATLTDLIASPARRLPIFLISDFDGKVFGDLHETLSQDICGLCHVCMIDNEATWSLSQWRGQQWSCYNGAARIYWPFRGADSSPFEHKLFTLDNMMRQGEDEDSASKRIRRIIQSTVLEASAFVADDPRIEDFEKDFFVAEFEKSVRGAAEEGDDAALMTLYEQENKRLAVENREQKKRITDLENQIELLQQNVAALYLAQRAETIEPALADPRGEPETIRQAIEMAMDELGDRVEFSLKIFDQAESLNAKAGPPEKVLRYLLTLGELAKALDAGPLGRTVVTWLRENGVEASIESETTKASKAAQRERTFPFSGGREVHCELHAKPADGVSPDQCVRIYFQKQDARPFVLIGYVGRHF